MVYKDRLGRSAAKGGLTPVWKPKANGGRFVCRTCARYWYRRHEWPIRGLKPGGRATETTFTSSRTAGGCARQLAMLESETLEQLELTAAEHELPAAELWREVRSLYGLRWDAPARKLQDAAEAYLRGDDPDELCD